MHDLVYRVARRPEYGELMYSLRSMAANFPHRAVWIVGQVPEGEFVNCGIIPVAKGNDRYRNTSDAVLAAIGSDNVSDPFWMMDDDFFCLDPAAHTGWDRGPLTDTLIAHRPASEYRRGGVDALGLLKGMGIRDPLSYELHIPILVEKATMRFVIGTMREERLSEAFKRTVYGNLVGSPTTTRPDVKRQSPPLPDDWVSTSDGSFKGPVGDEIRRRFTVPTKYERPGRGGL